VTRIGRIEPGGQLRIVDRHGAAVASKARAFDHFRP
jgi:hypothetical protein